MLLRFTIYKLLIKKIEQIRDFSVLFLNEEMQGDLWEFWNELIEQKKPKIIVEILVIHRIVKLLYARLLIAISRHKFLLYDKISSNLYQNKNSTSFGLDYQNKHNQAKDFFAYDSLKSDSKCEILSKKRRKHRNCTLNKPLQKATLYRVVSVFIVTFLASIISKCGGSAKPLIGYSHNLENKIHSSILTPAAASPPKSSMHNFKRRKFEDKQLQAEEQQLQAEEKQRQAEEQQLQAEEKQRQAEIELNNYEAMYWLKIAQERRKEAAHWLCEAQAFKLIAKNFRQRYFPSRTSTSG